MSVKFCFHLPREKSRAVLSEGLMLNVPSSKATVLLIHGLTGAPNEMKFLANYFYRKGYSVICPRLAHHGAPLAELKKARWQEFYQSIKQSLAKIDPNQKVIIGGLSMGALLALLAAEEFPERIAAVSCLSPGIFYDGWNVPWSHRLLPLVYYTPFRHFAYFKEEPPYGIKNERIRRKIHQYYKDASLTHIKEPEKYGYPYFPATLFNELRLLIDQLKKKLPLVTTPVQLIQAFEDDMTSVKNSQYIYERVKSEKKDMVLLYNSYHVITADQERETVANKMEEFYSSLMEKPEVFQSRQ